MKNIYLVKNTQKVNKQKLVAKIRNSYWLFVEAERDISI